MKNYAIITIEGMPIGLKFGIPCIRHLVERKVVFQESEEGANKNYTELDIAHIFYAAYINNCMVKEIQPILMLENFSDYIEESLLSRNIDDILIAMKVFSESKIVKDLAKIGAQDEPDDKKKEQQLTGTT